MKPMKVFKVSCNHEKIMKLTEKLREDVISSNLKGLGFKRISKLFNVPRDINWSIIKKSKT